MGNTPNYNWPHPDPANPPNVPLDMGNLAKAADATVKNLDNRVAAAEAKNTAQDNRMGAIDQWNINQDRRLDGHDAYSRVSGMQFTSWDPWRVVRDNTEIELAIAAYDITVPSALPPGTDHVLLTASIHADLRAGDNYQVGIKVNGNWAPFGLPSPIGVRWGVHHSTYTWDLVLPAGVHRITWWARVLGADSQVNIGSIRSWTQLI